MRNEGGEHWESVRYPAEAVEDEKFRKKGEALHPERYDETALARIKKAVGPRVWNALYQQNPVPDEGAYFTKSMFRFYDTPPELLEVYNTWDLAIGQKQQNDWTVGLQWGVDKDDNIYVLNLLRARMDALQIVEAILDMWVAHPNTQACGIEEGQIKLTMGPMLEKRVAERRLFNFHQIPLKPGRQDKVARARTIQGRMQQGRVFFPKIENAPWMEKLIDEMLAFPFGKNDDQVDTLGYCGLMAAEVTPPTIDTAFKNADVGWKAKLQGFVANGRKVKSWLEA
jgi:predicted phage terminase large subunit-like protein